MTKHLHLLLFLFASFTLEAQDSIVHRIILIGDAGEMDASQKQILTDAANRSLPGRTTTVFLGDNIYPRGIGLPGQTDQRKTEEIIRSQFAPLRKAGSAVYFIPGNHDWDRMGTKGLAKIRRQWQFLQEQNDSMLALIPRNGCPDPTVLEIDDKLVIIALDSEWWLFPFEKENPAAECDCQSRSDILQKLIQLRYEHRNKTILLATHHPFRSYGTHGGKYSWKDHIFPLTQVKPKLYIPLPIVGSLYPLLRQTFSNPEDLGHPLYKDMVREIDSAFAGHPNLFHVSGHEHGLQLIENEAGTFRQIVSGAGAKLNHTIKGRHSLFGKEAAGYVVADWMADNQLRLHFFELKDSAFDLAFEKAYPQTASKEFAEEFWTDPMADSVKVAIRPIYDKASKLKRSFLGENYRKEFSTEVSLPLLRLSNMKGGLTPLKRGGGMQTVSLRLEAADGTEWVLRNLRKNPDALLPYSLRETFARDLLDDYMSAQHPFSPLVVPPLASAVGVAHSNPVIGMVAPDKNMGIYQRWFAGKIALFEQREPAGKSDNTPKMIEKLVEDNDNSYDAKNFLRARMLDLLLGDWDRHSDQWRWADSQKGKQKYYQAVPRDRDQALFIRRGLLSKLASRSWVLPTLQGFDSKISHPKYALLKSGFLNAYLPSQLPYEVWEEEVKAFTNAITDAVIDSAFQELPAEIYAIRGREQAETMKARRNAIPKAMNEYYRFISQRVDIRASDKNEKITLTSLPDGKLDLLVQKISKNGKLEDTLAHKSFSRKLTRELRIYLQAGDDSVVINNNSRIKVRLIGGDGHKQYRIDQSRRKIRLYDLPSSAHIAGKAQKLRAKFNSDTSIVRFRPVNLYHITMPLVTAGYNMDDGLIFGLGFRHTHQGFRKEPFASQHQLTAAHSFSTRAYQARYRGQWTTIWKNTDLVADLHARAPDNTQNYFGSGNKSLFDKRDDGIRYYRTRFSIYMADLQLRRASKKAVELLTGPSLQWYRYDRDENQDRFIETAGAVGSYDSSSIEQEKWHLGWTLHLKVDKRNQPVLTSHGAQFEISLRAYSGLNTAAKSYGTAQFNLSIYRPLNIRRSIVLANRLGGGTVFGKAAFYQNLFLGGQGNLLGFRQYRFAGDHMLFNNLELRIKLADWGGYILPGQFGFTGFFDIGRVWFKNEESSIWHKGTGAGFYFAPARMALFQLVAGYSREGWLPYFTAGFRF